MSADPIDFLGSPQGREVIECGADALMYERFHAHRRTRSDDTYWRDSLDANSRHKAASVVLASALSDRLCDTCGGDELLAQDGMLQQVVPCPDCSGSGRRPSVLVPRGEQHGDNQ